MPINFLTKGKEQRVNPMPFVVFAMFVVKLDRPVIQFSNSRRCYFLTLYSMDACHKIDI